jgi:hypothetical protein
VSSDTRGDGNGHHKLRGSRILRHRDRDVGRWCERFRLRIHS